MRVIKMISEILTIMYTNAVASLRLVSPGAMTNGVTLFYLK